MTNTARRETHERTDPRLRGRVAVVTGASSGIGRAIATRLAAEGASVVCGDLQRRASAGGLDPQSPVDEQIAAAGGEATFVEWDITDATQTAAAFDVAREKYGRVDIVVANAGIVVLNALAVPDETPETWQRHLDVNLTGTWNTVQYGLRALIDQGEGGRIITMSSASALKGLKGFSGSYGAAKAAVIQLTRQAAVEGGPYGITANCVAPGWVRTAINAVAWRDNPDMIDNVLANQALSRLGEAGEVAGAVAFLASADGAFTTGIVLPVDGGMSNVQAGDRTSSTT